MKPTPRLITIVAAALVIIGLGAGYKNAHAAFGVSPPFVNADKLVKGATFEQTIYLVRDVGDTDLPIKGVLDLPEKVRSWVSIDPGTEFTIPQGVGQFPVKIKIKVPQDTELAAYSGKVVFTGNPTQSGQVTIALGAQVAINIVVGNDIYRKFEVRVVKVQDIEEGWNPQVYVKADNQGNVPESFTGGTLEILDQYGSVRLAFLQNPKKIAEIPPFTMGENIIEFPIDMHLGLGQYWGVVNLYQNDKLIVSQKTVFNVLKRGSLSKQGAMVLQLLRDYWMYAAGGLLLLMIIVFGVLRLRRR